MPISRSLKMIRSSGVAGLNAWSSEGLTEIFSRSDSGRLIDENYGAVGRVIPQSMAL
jgi:hypothetical protein